MHRPTTSAADFPGGRFPGRVISIIDMFGGQKNAGRINSVRHNRVDRMLFLYGQLLRLTGGFPQLQHLSGDVRAFKAEGVCVLRIV